MVLSSLADPFAGPNVVGCVTMKHALIGFIRSVARDYGRQGLRINTVLLRAPHRAARVAGASLLIDGGASAVDLPTIAFAP